MKTVTAVIIALALGLAACSSSGDTLKGTVLLTDMDGGMGAWDDCEGNGGYSDMSDGVNVSIEDQDGRAVGASSLQNISEADLSQLAEDSDFAGDSAEEALELLEDLEGLVCAFTFEADDVESSEIYVITIGSKRGEQSYTRKQLEERNWWVSLSIGDV